MLKFIIQSLIVLACCVFTMKWVGAGYYLFGGGAVAFIVLVVFLRRYFEMLRVLQMDQEQRKLLGELLGFGGMVIYSIGLGMIWPSLPLIIGVGSATAATAGESTSPYERPTASQAGLPRVEDPKSSER